MIKNRKMYAVLSPFFLLGFLVMTLLATPALTVYSADVSGSLTVIQKDAENKAPLADVELSIYQVASYKDNTFHTAHLTPDFVKSGIDLNESMTADKQYVSRMLLIP